MRTSNLFTTAARRGAARLIAMFLFILLLGTASAAAQGQSVLRIVAPNGGETVVIDSTTRIRWFASGITGTLTIEYSADSGATWKFVDTAVARVGIDSVAWVVPNIPTKLALVRISTADGERSGRSMRTFTIAKEPLKTLRVVYPNGGETVVIDSTIRVVWNAQYVTGNLDLEYSIDSAKSWNPIKKTAARTGNDTILWKVPNQPSTTAFVRVSTEDDQVTARSNRAFTIAKELPRTLRVIQPNGGELFGADSSVRITWLSTNVVGDIRVDYSVDSGKSWKPIRTVTAKGGANDTTTWKIPNDTTSRGMVRVSTGDGAVSDASNGVFTIRTKLNPNIRLMAPNGGEQFTADSTIRIIWSAQDLTGLINATYSVDTGRTWKPIMGSRQGRTGLDTIVWKIPNDPSPVTMLRVGNNSARDTSDGSFTIIGLADSLTPTITVIRPNGGEVFKVGTAESIVWETKNLTGQLNLHYSADSGKTWKMLSGRPSVSGGIDSTQWIVPNDPTTRALLRLTLAGSGGGGGGGGNTGLVRDLSNAVFTIFGSQIDTTAAYLQLLYPNGGERLSADSIVKIRWKANNLQGKLFLAYSADGGPWRLIDSADARQGNDSLTWSVPDIASTNTHIMVSTADGLVKDLTDNGFRLISIGTTGVKSRSNVPGGLTLIGSFPDPASSSTEIRWTQNVSGHVLLRIYDLNGRAVQNVDIGEREAGEMRAVLDVSKLAPGMYVYELMIGAGSLRGGLRVDR